MPVLNKQEYQALDEGFGRCSDIELREMGLEAVRDFMPKPDEPEFAASVPFGQWSHKFLAHLLPDLPLHSQQANAIARSGMADWSPRQSDPRGVTRTDLFPKLFWHWMVRSGHAVQFHESAFVITPLGKRRLSSEHPCRPGALERLRQAHGSDFGDSLNRLDDAVDCLDAGLARAAVVLLGLAFEEMIALVLARLTGRKVDELKQKASVSQEQLRKRLENDPKSEARLRALTALNAADDIRTARNDAAHKAAGEWDMVQAEELLANGISAFPKLAGYQP